MNFDMAPQDVVSLNLNNSFEQRFLKLRRGKVRIAYYYDFPDETTFRYRVYNMIEAIDLAQVTHPRKDIISASWFCRNDAEKFLLAVDNCDIVVFVRARYSVITSNAICRAKMRGRQIYYDIDDIVVFSHLIPLIISTLDQDVNNEAVWQYWFQYVGRLRAVLDECDQVLATNDTLATEIETGCGKNTRTLPNFYNLAQHSISESIRRQSYKNKSTRNGVFRIGYFSGSPSHNRDFEIAAGALSNLMRDNSNIELLVVGFLGTQRKFRQFGDRLRQLPFMNFGQLQHVVAQVDLNIVPLQDNIFTRCKSQLKFFESALVLTPTIASQTGSFSETINDGCNGWLAHPQMWYEKLHMVASLHEKSSVEFFDVARSALKKSESLFSYEAASGKLLSVFNLP